MLAVYTELKNAQNVKEFLIKKGLISLNYQIVKKSGYIYFPLKKKANIPKAKFVNTKFSFPKKQLPQSLNDLLKKSLTKEELVLIPKSQEIVGKIMILEIPYQLRGKERIIAETYLRINKNINTVVKKEQIHSGIYRLRKVKVLAGKRTKETIHSENGIKIKLNLEKTYFSARSANERLRLAKLVKPNENILVMFSGAAPFPLVFAKNSPLKIVYGIEINPDAHCYALENVQINNLKSKIKLFQGDVRKILPKIKKKFDRIALPLPKTGEEFLDLALKKIKIGGTIHLYSFLNEANFNKYAQKIKEICKKNKHQIRICKKVKCGQFSPQVYRVCFDLKIINNS